MGKKSTRRRSLWERVTRATLFWPCVMVVGPRIPRLAAVAVLAVSPPGQAAEAELAAAQAQAAADVCEEEFEECTTYCRASYRGDPERLRECLDICDENYDICVYDVYGGDDGCESDPDAAELLACGVIVGSEVVCEAIASEGCACEAEEEASEDSFAVDDGLSDEGDFRDESGDASDDGLSEEDDVGDGSGDANVDSRPEEGVFRDSSVDAGDVLPEDGVARHGT